MAISSNNTLLNMQITVKELNDKHQLNPNNNGIKTIDQCMCFINNALGISEITGISVVDEDTLYFIELDKGYVTIPASAFVMKSDGTFGSIQSATLYPADRLKQVSASGEISEVRIIDFRRTATRSLIYRIKTHRGNYILSNGLIIKAD